MVRQAKLGRTDRKEKPFGWNLAEGGPKGRASGCAETPRRGSLHCTAGTANLFAVAVAAAMVFAGAEAKPVFDGLLYGTQYYRAPTPLADEWDGDLGNLERYHLGTIQLRLNWRQYEPREGEYDFSDVDRLMDLAERHGRKVIIKFLLECAPQYVFDRLGGARIGPRGEKIPPGGIGAFYTGGWLPCFTNPKVAERAAKFVEKVAERYKDRRHLVMWNAWNEPRCKPIGECFCDSCRKAYGEHMRRRFGTIEALNRFYGVAEESFEKIALPGTTAGYWDIYEFKSFKSGECLYNNLKFVYDAVRRHDTTRPVISHVGFTGGFQAWLGDICDDWKVKQAVDGWGTSLPLSTCMGSQEERIEFCRLNDFMRSLNPDYFIYEIYPGIGAFKYQYDTPWDMYYKLYDALAYGSKGMFFWQYRAERVGDENDCAGLARADGSPRPVLDAVREFGETVGELGREIVEFYPRRADVAVVFDYRSHMISMIEDSQGFTDVVPWEQMLLYYANAHRGFYHMLKERGVEVDYLNARDMVKLTNYKVVYFPYYTMIDPQAVPHMERFVADGGILIADEGFGLRDLNTWMNPYDIKCGRLMKARLSERRKGKRGLATASGVLNTSGYHSEYAVEGARAMCLFDNGKPAAQVAEYGKGKTCLLGFSLGYSYMKRPGAEWGALFDRLTGGIALRRQKYGDVAAGLEERRLVKGDDEFVFLINTTDAEKRVRVDECVCKVYARGRMDGDTAVVPARSCMILRFGRGADFALEAPPRVRVSLAGASPVSAAATSQGPDFRGAN